ncbi:MAG TPA: helical backbone metal receptor [Candidatus Thermoplasmatota archaeon]|nr:helical backbone metal receptor [Candidatus Thermoplasmatota archaeon]
MSFLPRPGAGSTLAGGPAAGEPARIVSLVPSHTETLYALGLASRVVGRTRFCIHPAPWVEAVPAVGGTKDARLERILALRPDLVVADKDENPKALADALLENGVEVLWSEIDTVPDAAAFVERLADRCGVAAEGHRAAVAIRAALAEAAGAGGGARVFCPIWHGPWMTFDRTAYPSAMLEAVGLRNAFAGHAGPKYFQVEPAEVASSGAQWTLLPTEPFPFHRRRVDTAPLGPAGQPGRVRAIDGEALTWFGVRTAPGLRELARVARTLAVSGAAATPRSP